MSNTTACPKSPLVEALRDGRLGPSEIASVERHVAGCAACTELSRDLDRIGASLRAPRPQATPLEHQRARVSLLERAALAPSMGRAAPRRSLVYVLAAAMLALAAGAGWAAGRGSAPVAAAPPAAPRAAVAETAIRPSDDASFERSRADRVEVVTLAHGTLDVTVRPLAQGERFVVRTQDAEIEVRGTAFRVEAAGGRIRSVAVSEGAVEVRYAGFSAVIPSGGSWRSNDSAPAAAQPAPTAQAAVDAPAVDAPRPAADAPKPVADALKPVAAKVAAIAPRPIAARAAPSKDLKRDEPVAAPPEVAPAVEAPKPAAATPSVASRAFADAMSALGRGDYAGSAAQLEAFATAHPSDARADEADYLLAVALQRAGRNADAAAAARRYLTARPSGAHRVEARQIAGP